MIDLHTHTFFSDGALSPSELVYRAKKNNYDAIALTDHGDYSNVDFVIPRIQKVAKILTEQYKIEVLTGIELTYVPPKLIPELTKISRKLGAKLVLVHGESPVEPVPPGTNNAAVISGIDILAHPGFISEKDCILAKKNGVCLEITTRKGHCKGNLHISGLAKKYGLKLVLNTDAHEENDLLNPIKIRQILKESQLDMEEWYKKMEFNSWKIVRRCK